MSEVERLPKRNFDIRSQPQPLKYISKFHGDGAVGHVCMGGKGSLADLERVTNQTPGFESYNAATLKLSGSSAQ